jgi:hypothetical protein
MAQAVACYKCGAENVELKKGGHKVRLPVDASIAT